MYGTYDNSCSCNSFVNNPHNLNKILGKLTSLSSRYNSNEIQMVKNKNTNKIIIIQSSLHLKLSCKDETIESSFISHVFLFIVSSLFSIYNSYIIVIYKNKANNRKLLRF